MGLALAMVARVIMLLLVVTLAGMTRPLIRNLSVRDLILLAGGLFLLYVITSYSIHYTKLYDLSAHPPFRHDHHPAEGGAGRRRAG